MTPFEVFENNKNLFVLPEDDFHNEKLKRPVFADSCVYVSETHMLMAIDINRYEGNYNELENMKLPASFTFDLTGMKHIGILSTEELNSVLDDIPEEEVEYEDYSDVHECPECNGEGEVEWFYESNDGHTYNDWNVCPICDGTGEIGEPTLRKTGELKKKDYCLISFGDITNISFNSNYINTLAKVINDSELATIDVYSLNPTSLCFSLNNDIKILICGINNAGITIEDYKIYHINI